MNDFDPGPGFIAAVRERIAARATWVNGCLVMSGKREHNGQVRISVQGRQMGAHRAAWMAYHEQSIAEGLVIRHACDNPPCVAEAHLLIGTQMDNIADRTKRNRNKPRWSHETCINGHPRTNENTRFKPDGRRECRDCARIREAARPLRRYRDSADAKKRAEARRFEGHDYVATV